MTKQPKVRKPHPVLHGIGLVLSAILLVAVLAGTYVLSMMATYHRQLYRCTQRQLFRGRDRRH